MCVCALVVLLLWGPISPTRQVRTFLQREDGGENGAVLESRDILEIEIYWKSLGKFNLRIFFF